MYRIKWTSKITGTSGYGTGIFTKEEAELIAKMLNKQPDAVCFHQAVAVEKGKTNV